MAQDPRRPRRPDRSERPGCEGHGWDSDRWGRWPTAADLERVAPGRRCALWAHDHHALLASRRRPGDRAGSTERPPIRPVASSGTTADGRARGSAPRGRQRARHGPRPASVGGRARGAAGRGRATSCWRSVSSPSTIPAASSPDSDLGWSYPGLRPSRRDRPSADCASWRRCGPSRSRPRSSGACGAARSSVGTRRAGPVSAGRSASPTARSARGRPPCWPTSRPSPTDRSRRICGAASGTRARAAARARRTGSRGRHRHRRSTPSATLRSGRRSTSSSRPPGPSRSCPGSSTSSCSTPRIAGGSPRPGSRPASSRSISGATRPRLAGCGARAPNRTATRGHRSQRPGPSSRSGPMPRSSRSTHGPGSRWPSPARIRAGRPGPRPFGPHEALPLERAIRSACLDPAVSARETDRGRLTVGQRADLVVMPLAAVLEPVEPGGALATARPSLVMIDGRVVFEA